MSTFNGQIAGMPSASVDRFDGINVRSAVFFLSHCHTDHMVGLAELASADKSTDAAVMYLSAVSAVIVRGLYTELPLRLVPLTVGGIWQEKDGCGRWVSADNIHNFELFRAHGCQLHSPADYRRRR